MILFLSDKKSLTSNQSLTLNPSPKERDLRTMAANPLSCGEGWAEAFIYNLHNQILP